MVDIGHGRGWLSATAAASIQRIDAALGHPLQITEAGRTGERQQELRDLWLDGKGFYAAPRGESPHERGDAVDSDEAQRHLDLMAEHGWYRPLDDERWHFLHRPSRDQHRNDPAPAGHTTSPAPTPQEDDMRIYKEQNGTYWLVKPNGCVPIKNTQDLALLRRVLVSRSTPGAEPPTEEVFNARERDLINQYFA